MFLKLKRDLPPGTPYSEVTAYIGSNGEQSNEINGSLSIHLGRIPSRVWFCNFFDDYAKLTFTGRGTLERMDRETIGQCL